MKIIEVNIFRYFLYVIYLAVGLVKTRKHVLIWAPMWISFIKVIN